MKINHFWLIGKQEVSHWLYLLKILTDSDLESMISMLSNLNDKFLETGIKYIYV